jgi:hypothetical protein
MNQDQRRLYNKSYYATNKDKILNDLCSKVECELCGRTVIKNNIKKHYDTELCARTQERRETIKLRLNQ